MAKYEFYEYREREHEGDVTSIEVACEKQQGLLKNTRVVAQWDVDDTTVSLTGIDFRDDEGQKRKLSGIDFSIVERVVAIAVTKIEERGYDVDSPFEREALEAALGDEQ